MKVEVDISGDCAFCGASRMSHLWFLGGRAPMIECARAPRPQGESAAAPERGPRPWDTLEDYLRQCADIGREPNAETVRRLEVLIEQAKLVKSNHEHREINYQQFLRDKYEVVRAAEIHEWARILNGPVWVSCATPEMIAQIEQTFDVQLEVEPWTCDNHREPITYTDGTTECYCGNKK